MYASFLLEISHLYVTRSPCQELFHYVQRLRHLGLSGVEAESLPAASLPLPNLVELDAGANRLTDLAHLAGGVVGNGAAGGMPELRRLNLSSNLVSVTVNDDRSLLLLCLLPTGCSRKKTRLVIVSFPYKLQGDPEKELEWLPLSIKF